MYIHVYTYYSSPLVQLVFASSYFRGFVELRYFVFDFHFPMLIFSLQVSLAIFTR